MRKRKMDPWILLSAGLIALWLVASIGNTVFRDGKVDQETLRYDADGKLSVAPFGPSIAEPFGTDRQGNDLFEMMVEGAKWTIGTGLVVAFARVLFGLVAGAMLAFTNRRRYQVVESFFDSFTDVPITLLSFMILSGALIFTSDDTPPSFVMRAGFEVFVLVLLGLPTVMFYFASEVRKLMGEEFMLASSTMGGGRWHQFRKHLFPHLKDLIGLTVMQQFVQTLIVLSHLGILHLFFAGSIIKFDSDPQVVTHEWSGALGAYFRGFTAFPWIFIVPVACFAMTIICGNIIVIRLQRRRMEDARIEVAENESEAAATSLEPFELVSADEAKK